MNPQYLPKPSPLVNDARQSQVQDQTSSLHNNLERLHKEIESLTNRLAGVVSPVIRKEEMGPNAPTPVLVPLADTLRTANAGIDAATMKIEDLIRSIEL
jgi:hypothetical protein